MDQGVRHPRSQGHEHQVIIMSVVPIEKVFAKNKDSLKLRESEWIKEFGTLVPRGMNIKS